METFEFIGFGAVSSVKVSVWFSSLSPAKNSIIALDWWTNPIWRSHDDWVPHWRILTETMCLRCPFSILLLGENQKKLHFWSATDNPKCEIVDDWEALVTPAVHAGISCGTHSVFGRKDRLSCRTYCILVGN